MDDLFLNYAGNDHSLLITSFDWPALWDFQVVGYILRRSQNMRNFMEVSIAAYR